MQRNQDLIEMREALGLTRQALADQLEVSHRTVVQYELGKRSNGTPSKVPKIYRLALQALLAGLDQ